MAATRLWRRRVVAANLSSRPSEVDGVPLLRPLALLRDDGFDVHAVIKGAVRERAEVEGLSVWLEPDIRSVAARIARLRAELLWVESITYGAVLAPLGRRSWIRNPLPAAGGHMRMLQRAVVRRFDAVSFTNPAARQAWSFDEERHIDLPYPVDVGWWAAGPPRRESWWTDRGRSVPAGPVLACISAYVSGKRLCELLEMLAPWLLEHPPAVLVFVGHQFVDPELTRRLTEMPAALGVEDQVLVTGWISPEEIRALLAWTAVGLVNTEAETQCLAIYESLAAGVPMLIPNLPELTSQFPTLLAHRDGAELRDNLDRLLADKRLRQNALETTRERLAWADVSRHDEILRAGVRRLVG